MPKGAFLLKDLSHELQSSIWKHLFNYTIGFVKVVRDKDRVDAFSNGSGTLVFLDGIYGFLTAHHVATSFPNTGPIGVVFRSDLHCYTLQAETLVCRCLDRGTSDIEGPDIAFVQLPHAEVETLAATKSFCNLDLRIVQIHAPPGPREGVWAISGYVAEGTKQEAGRVGYSSIRAFNHFVGIGGIKTIKQRGSYDDCEMPVSYGVREGVPLDFGGMSGGGLWQLTLRRDKNQQLEIDKVYLSGLAFYQTAVTDNRTQLICHGPESVTKMLPHLLRSQAHVNG
jgi:hypothetical protein